MLLRDARWLAVPSTVFALALGGSFAYHSLTGESAGPSVRAELGPAVAEDGPSVVGIRGIHLL